ncbi:substrate-binding domain-containing protein [Brevibacillus choshinensis]|uniref:Helix-turn-helix domain-containing protein n=1 Tax=Brevibacillus choshinensis TaxID=54911 RepID=A0ABX7FTT1_BRECH|nr:substrate-binding domain-containing protein [Brevibacillus choshinensis]QRG69210.1 helix-turn-helix domain-containing protein [Brevibacillus choshinensis]
MESDYLTPDEVAAELKLTRYTVYEMIKRKELPASKIGRTLRILRSDLDAFMQMNKSREDRHPFAAVTPRRQQEQAYEILFAGSHDLTIDLLARKLAERGITLLPAFSGSLDGLIELYKGRVEMAGTHLLDRTTGEYNLPYIRCLLPNEGVTVVNLVNRWQGFVVPKGNPRMITSWDEFLCGSHRIVNRQRGSGTRVLLDFTMQQKGIAPEALPGYDVELTTHYATAAAVLQGNADAALGIESVARGLGLDFFPIQEERYDLVIPTRLARQDRFIELLSVLRDPVFKQAIVAQGGYNVSQTGKEIDRMY